MPPATAPCPECGTNARQIPTETVRNMVKPFGNRTVEDDIQYRICKTTDCPVVYFADERDHRFEVDVIRERLNIKRPLGGCCLGNVRAAISEAEDALEVAH